ncbi:MAG: bifunctional pyr operon transcriptional regulator/uracil phosphoribosyltransferase PyrR [Erysipelothrix sp.]|jgi:pyrimidine operon attenuation protein/uracil phosphoribosyltransferase|nr:bifunctional pyr operon transcriptional regulator/uracil phosphoribosyltransferase PyrR [Erysipelothrix sp.]
MKEIMDHTAITRSITRLSHEIIERNKSLDDVVLVGVKTRGVHLAQRLQSMILQFTNIELPIGSLNIRPWRDDLIEEVAIEPLDVDVKDKRVILVDDVLYTGRTIRAAMDGLVYFGRPKQIQLAVLVDRGHKEFPIKGDYVGKNIPTGKDEEVIVQLKEIDLTEGVFIQ